MAINPVKISSKSNSFFSLPGRIVESGVNAVWKTISCPLGLHHWNLNPIKVSPAPSESLKKIGVASRKILRDAEGKQIKPAPTPPPRLSALSPSPPLSSSPALNEDSQIKINRLKGEINQKIDNLSCRLSNFTILWHMKSLCGIDPGDNTDLFPLVNQASAIPNPPSVWRLFMGQYGKQIGIVNWIRTGLYYFFYHTTSLLSSTIDAYLRGYITRIQEQLTGKNGEQQRTAIIKTILDQACQFLTIWNGVTKKFAYTSNPKGDLDFYRDQAVKNFYNNNLEELCKNFSETLVDANPPKVPFFKLGKQIPILGFIFKGAEWLLNKLIQSKMKSSILPAALFAGVTNGLEAANPNNLPFIYPLTQFFTGQLQKLNEKLDAGNRSYQATPVVPGTEKLPAVIKELKLALVLQSCTTQEEIKSKLTENEKGKWFLPHNVETGIEEGILEGGKTLFEYVNDPDNTHELFDNLLYLATLPLSRDTPPDKKELIKLFEDEKITLKREARDAFIKLIRPAVEQQVRGSSEELRKQEIANFELQKEGVARSFSQAIELCKTLKEKVAKSKSIQSEIVTLSQIMQALSNRSLNLSETKEIDQSGKQALSNALTPLYQRAASLAEKMERLQKLDTDHISYSATYSTLLKAEECVVEIPKQLKNPPALKRALASFKETALFLKDVPPLPTEDPIFIQLLAQIEKEEKILEGLYTLAPPPNEKERTEGLLEGLANYHRGAPIPPGFSPAKTKDSIKAILGSFPAEKAAALRLLIADGKNLADDKQWENLGKLLKEMVLAHGNNQEKNMNDLEALLKPTLRWIQQKEKQYHLQKEKNYKELQTEIDQVSEEACSIFQEAEELQLQSPWRLGGIRLGGSLIGMAGGGLLAGPVGIAAGAMGGWVSGKTVEKSIEAGLSHRSVLPLVMNFFDNAFDFVTKSSLVYEAFATRTMKALSNKS